jgi:hypothetical protein
MSISQGEFLQVNQTNLHEYCELTKENRLKATTNGRNILFYFIFLLRLNKYLIEIPFWVKLIDGYHHHE